MPEITFDGVSMANAMLLERPKNQKALALYLLLLAGKRGVNNFEAVKDSFFWKYNTRISDLINKHELQVHKHNEAFVNRFGHKGNTVRYCLYECDLSKNLELYKKLNQK